MLIFCVQWKDNAYVGIVLSVDNKYKKDNILLSTKTLHKQLRNTVQYYKTHNWKQIYIGGKKVSYFSTFKYKATINWKIGSQKQWSYLSAA